MALGAEEGQAVPSFFRCPVHLGIMKDPVTLSTGITYDRRSIERWLAAGHRTCPTTNQTLESFELIPNHTLQRAIQSWRAANPAPARKGVEVDVVRTLLDAVDQSADTSACLDSLKELYSVAEECGRNRRALHDAGAVPVLVDALNALGVSRGVSKGLEYAIAVAALLDLDDADRRALAAPPTFTVLCSVLATGSTKAKINAATVVHFVCGEDACLKILVGKHPAAMSALVMALRDDGLTTKETEAGLRCLLSLVLPKKNRAVAVAAHAVHALVELLPRTHQTRNVEYACAVLEVLAHCAEGREAIADHPFAIARLVAFLLGVSNTATEHVAGALLAVVQLAANRDVINTALLAGAFPKLLMILPSDCSPRAKAKARHALKLLNEVCGTSTSTFGAGPSVLPRGSSHHRPLSLAES